VSDVGVISPASATAYHGTRAALATLATGRSMHGAYSEAARHEWCSCARLVCAPAYTGAVRGSVVSQRTAELRCEDHELGVQPVHSFFVYRCPN